MTKCHQCEYWESDNRIKGKCLNGIFFNEQYNKFSYDDLVPYLQFGWDKKTIISLGTDWEFQCKYGKRKEKK
ncbi:hypothetical protein KO361_03200 [Candidatus Woesearchaeota archaeon]|nr:hypothetical protein [Candidatus Woesearchaeota archaeon]